MGMSEQYISLSNNAWMGVAEQYMGISELYMGTF